MLLNARKTLGVSAFLLGLTCVSICLAQDVDRVFTREDLSNPVTRDLVVPFGEIWKIEAGAEVCFQADVTLKVDGILIAKGEHDKRIIFRACDPNEPWGGLRFVDSRQMGNTRSSLHNVVIQEAQNVIDGSGGFDRNSAAGGGLFVLRSDLEVFGAIVRRNQAGIGGGVYIGHDSDVLIQRSAIYDNEAKGSRYVASGGGGIYIEGTRRARVLRNVIAANRFHQNTYPNEEGGGGVYVASGPVEFAYNLVIGNSSGKGAGMLVLGYSSKPLTFAANIFVYNSGSRNLEQVALQTRYSFDVLRDVGNWSINAGQAPFVAHLNRNRLSRYPYKGSTAFLEQLKAGSPVQFVPLIKDKANAAVLGSVEGALRGARLCGNASDFGPIENCTGDGQSLHDYLSLLGRFFEPELGTLLKQRFAAPESDALSERDYSRLAELIAPMPEHRGWEGPIDPKLVDLVFGSSAQRNSAIESIANTDEDPPQRGEMSAPLLVKALGWTRSFDLLVKRSRPKLSTLKNTVKLANEEAALALLNSSHYEKVLSSSENKKALHELLQLASEANLTKVVEKLLQRRIDPNLALRDRLPLIIAVREGQLDMVQLLLRSGADPNGRGKFFGNRPLLPVLAYAIHWFHLGSGRHEIAELLVAAGANLSKEDWPGSVWSDTLRLKSSVQMGIVAADDASEIAKGIKPTTGIDHSQQLLEGKVAVSSVIVAIRRLREEPHEKLATILSDAGRSNDQRIAAGRVLSVRNFRATRDLRKQLLSTFQNSTDRLSETINLERILKFRSILSIQSSRGGGNPAAIRPRLQDNGIETLLPYGRKFAVLIGISDYGTLPSWDSEPGNGSHRDLKFGEADAFAVLDLIEEGRLGSRWEVEKPIGPRATKAKVGRVMELWLEEAKEDDLVLFFFAGHSFSEPWQEGKRNYFFLQDSELDSLNETALSFAEVREWANSLKARHVLLLLDTCYSADIGSTRGDRSSIDYQELDDTRARQKAGKIALTSSMGGQLSYELSTLGRGLFTAALVDALNGKITIHTQDQFVTVLDLYEAVQSSVIDRSRGNKSLQTQVPDYVLLDGDALLNFPIAFAP